MINQNYYFIVDCSSNEILYASSSFSKILGYSKEDYTYLEMMELVHPEDIEYVKNCERKTTQFISTLTENEEFKFAITYTFRKKIASGKYIQVRQNYQVLELNKDGSINQALIIHEIIEPMENRKPDDFRAFDRQSNRSIAMHNTFNLTRREAEILELIKEGLTSLEISNKLYVSKLTVDTHRKNILAKTKSRKFITMVKEDIH